MRPDFNFPGTNQVEIFSEAPVFDEDYEGDLDDEIEVITKKYDFHINWGGGIYGKSIGAVEYTANKNTMKNKTLVKAKIVLSDDGANLVTYFWKKTFWMFGYWYPFGSSYCTGTQPTRKVERVTDANVSKVLYDNFIHPL